jgi:beta-lactamase class A
MRRQIPSALLAAAALVLATITWASVQPGSPAASLASPKPAGSPTPVATPSTTMSQTVAPPSAPAAEPPSPASEPPSPTAPAATAVAVEPAPVVAPVGPELDAQVNGIINANSRYQLGVALIDMSDGVVHEYGVRAKFVAASTAKILAAAAYYHLTETGSAALTAPLGSSTAVFQIRQMVQQSNNESWALIVGAIGYQRLNDYAASIGIPYDRAVNTLTPAEMARVLALLYTGQLLNGTNTAQLLSYMQHTNYETLIPAAAPQGITVFHKYGLLFGNLHDASILVQDGRAYAFVVYTLGRDMTDIPARTAVIHQLTQSVAASLF